MRRLLFISLMGAAACSSSVIGSNQQNIGDASTGGGGASAAGCVSDTECKGTRVCDNGRCVEPATAATGGTSTGGVSTGGMPSTGGRGESGGQGLGGTILGTGGSRLGGPDASISIDASAGGLGGCVAVRQKPETVIVYRDATVTDTVITYKPVALFFMIDRSAGMVTGAPSGNANDWSDTVSAISSFVGDPASAGIDVGFGEFPTKSSSPPDCFGGSDCGSAVVPIASLPGNTSQIQQSLSAQTPGSLDLTPTECGLRGMINDCLRFMAQSPAGEQCVGVLVQGTPLDACDTNTQDLVNIVADGHSKGVTTYAIVLPGADLNFMTQVAKAGGTNAALDASGGVAAFTAALDGIRKAVALSNVTHVTTPTVVATPLPCEWVLPPPPSGTTFSSSKVNVEFTPSGGSPVMFGHVASQSDCARVTSPAWYYDNASSPTRVLFCPAACNQTKQAPGASIDLLFGCETLPATF